MKTPVQRHEIETWLEMFKNHATLPQMERRSRRSQHTIRRHLLEELGLEAYEQQMEINWNKRKTPCKRGYAGDPDPVDKRIQDVCMGMF